MQGSLSDRFVQGLDKFFVILEVGLERRPVDLDGRRARTHLELHFNVLLLELGKVLFNEFLYFLAPASGIAVPYLDGVRHAAIDGRILI
jgi:hypothetical protein